MGEGPNGLSQMYESWHQVHTSPFTWCHPHLTLFTMATILNREPRAKSRDLECLPWPYG